MSDRPVVVVTRRLPAAVEEAVARDFDARFNREDRPMTAAELQDALRSADGLLPTVTDKLNAEVLRVDPLRTRIVANIGVGFNNIDLQTAKARGIAVSNTPD
ncbi:MAG: D-glycerate dehydrogenase, partial [Gemmatimonadales bacterium]